MSGGAVARLGQALDPTAVAGRTGMGAGELASVAATVRDLYRWTPSLSADRIPGHGGLVAVDAHWPERNVSGVLFVNQGSGGGFVVHDLPASAGAHDVNSYLSHVVDSVPAAASAGSLAERSVTDPSELFCNVARSSGQSTLPVQSERTLPAMEVAERCGVEEHDILRVIDDMRTPIEQPGCFAHARRLGMPIEVTGQPVGHILG